MKISRRVVALLILVAIALLSLATPAAADAARGKYLASIMDCGGCHTPGYLLGKPDMARMFAGSEVGFFIPDLGYDHGCTSRRPTPVIIGRETP